MENKFDITLKKFRKNLSITQFQMSSIIGVSPKTYREKELGHYPFLQDEIIRIIQYFDLTAEQAFSMFYTNGVTQTFYEVYKLKKISS